MGLFQLFLKKKKKILEEVTFGEATNIITC